MKALFVYAYPALFDARSADRARLRALAAAIGELHVVSAFGRAHEERDGSLHLYGVASSRLMRPFTLARAARALIREHGIEIVSAQDPFEEGWAARRAVRGTRAKLSFELHTDPFSPWYTRTGNLRMNLLNRIRRRLADRTLPDAAHIRTVSARVKRSLIARYGSRIPEPSVIPIAVDPAPPAPAPLPAHGFDFSLIAVSRLEPEKRIEDILAALTAVLPAHPRTGLYVVGEGRARASLESRARSLGIAKSVVFLGARHAREARALMASADAFIQASAYEGYGMTFVEAALAGAPIIATDVGIMGDVFKDGESALIARVESPRSLAECITRLIEDLELTHALREGARAAAKAHLAQEGDGAAAIAADLLATLGRGY